MAEGKKLPISIVITAVDNVTYKVMGINEKLKRITAPVNKVKAAFAALGEEAGLGKLAKSIGKASTAGKELFSEFTGQVTRVAAAGAVAAASIFAITKSFATAGDEVATISQRLGLTTTAYQELRYAASRADVDQEMFNASMDKFNKGIGEAAAGTGEALQGFSALGIAVRDSSGRIRSIESLLPEVADKLGGIRSESLRAAIASKLFGREGAKLNGIFKEGSEGLRNLRKEAQDVGAVMTPEQIAAAEAFDDGMKKIGATLLMVRNVVGAALAPKLVELGERLQRGILDHREKIVEFANAFADRLPRVIDGLINVFSTLGRILSPVVSLVGWLADTFGESSLAIAGLLIYFGPTILALLKFSFAVGKVLFLVGKLGLVLAGLVGWPALLAAALIAAAVAVWKYWEPIKNFFSGIWDKVTGLFGGKAQMDLSTAPAATLGPAMGMGNTVDAAQRSSSSTNENHVVVDFNNLPRGTRVETKKADGGMDLFMGYAMAGM